MKMFPLLLNKEAAYSRVESMGSNLWEELRTEELNS